MALASRSVCAAVILLLATSCISYTNAVTCSPSNTPEQCFAQKDAPSSSPAAQHQAPAPPAPAPPSPAPPKSNAVRRFGASVASSVASAARSLRPRSAPPASASAVSGPIGAPERRAHVEADHCEFCFQAMQCKEPDPLNKVNPVSGIINKCVTNVAEGTAVVAEVAQKYQDASTQALDLISGEGAPRGLGPNIRFFFDGRFIVVLSSGFAYYLSNGLSNDPNNRGLWLPVCGFSCMSIQDCLEKPQCPRFAKFEWAENSAADQWEYAFAPLQYSKCSSVHHVSEAMGGGIGLNLPKLTQSDWDHLGVDFLKQARERLVTFDQLIVSRELSQHCDHLAAKIPELKRLMKTNFETLCGAGTARWAEGVNTFVDLPDLELYWPVGTQPPEQEAASPPIVPSSAPPMQPSHNPSSADAAQSPKTKKTSSWRPRLPFSRRSPPALLQESQHLYSEEPQQVLRSKHELASHKLKLEKEVQDTVRDTHFAVISSNLASEVHFQSLGVLTELSRQKAKVHEAIKRCAESKMQDFWV